MWLFSFYHDIIYNGRLIFMAGINKNKKKNTKVKKVNRYGKGEFIFNFVSILLIICLGTPSLLTLNN